MTKPMADELSITRDDEEGRGSQSLTDFTRDTSHQKIERFLKMGSVDVIIQLLQEPEDSLRRTISKLVSMDLGKGILEVESRIELIKRIL